MSDQTIIDLLHTDEERGYSLLIDRYTRYVAAVLSGVAKGALPAEDLEELAADVFFNIWKRRAELRPETLRPYIARTARNAVIDRLRKKRIDAVPYEEDLLQLRAGEQTDELAFQREQAEILEQAVRELGEPDREIFIRFYYFGEALKGIAQRLSLNPATAKTKLHRSRLKIKAALGERGYDCE